MKKLLVSWIFCLFLVWFAAPATASGYLDELFLTTEWWPQESQTGSLELNYFKANAYNFAGYQKLGPQGVIAVNGTFGSGYLDSGIFNATFKGGTRDFYTGVGGILMFDEEKMVVLPRINLGGKIGPEFFKVVLDADLYTLLLVNAGKLEVGIEINPLPVLQLYGGVNKLFIQHIIAMETLPGNIYQLRAKLDTKPVFLCGEANFFGSTPLYIGEIGVNIYSLTLRGRITYPESYYSVGVRFNY